MLSHCINKVPLENFILDVLEHKLNGGHDSFGITLLDLSVKVLLNVRMLFWGEPKFLSIFPRFIVLDHGKPSLKLNSRASFVHIHACFTVAINQFRDPSEHIKFLHSFESLHEVIYRIHLESTFGYLGGWEVSDQTQSWHRNCEQVARSIGSVSQCNSKHALSECTLMKGSIH